MIFLISKLSFNVYGVEFLARRMHFLHPGLIFCTSIGCFVKVGTVFKEILLALRELLSNGTVLCHIVNTLIPDVLEVSHLLLDNVGSFFLVELLC
jgi:hypothetical protein